MVDSGVVVYQVHGFEYWFVQLVALCPGYSVMYFVGGLVGLSLIHI